HPRTRREETGLSAADRRRDRQGIGEVGLIAAGDGALITEGEFAYFGGHLLLEFLPILRQPRLPPHVGHLGDDAAVLVDLTLQMVQVRRQIMHGWVVTDRGV